MRERERMLEWGEEGGGWATDNCKAERTAGGCSRSLCSELTTCVVRRSSEGKSRFVARKTTKADGEGKQEREKGGFDASTVHCCVWLCAAMCSYRSNRYNFKRISHTDDSGCVCSSTMPLPLVLHGWRGCRAGRMLSGRGCLLPVVARRGAFLVGLVFELFLLFFF